MKLRLRMGLVLFAILIPLVISLLFLERYFSEKLIINGIVNYVNTLIEIKGNTLCEEITEQEHFHPGPPDRDFEPHLQDDEESYDYLSPDDEMMEPEFEDEEHPPPDMNNDKFHKKPPRKPPHKRNHDNDFYFHPRDRGPDHKHHIRLFLYNKDFESVNEMAPILDQSLIDVIKNGESYSIRKINFEEDENIYEILFKTPWKDDNCTYILASKRIFTSFDKDLFTKAPAVIVLSSTIVVIIIVLLVLGTVIKRIRKLTFEIKKSAKDYYDYKVITIGNDEIAELGRSFNEAAEKVRHHMDIQKLREETLRNFLENTTHDVMIPLTVLQGYLRKIQQLQSITQENNQDDNKKDIKSTNTLKSAIEEAQYIASLINNLSIAAKLESSAPRYHEECINLNELISRCVNRYRVVAEQKNVNINDAFPNSVIWVKGDVTFIEQAVSNIIYNAVHYNYKNGNVAVILTNIDNKIFEIQVIDDGPGIPINQMSELIKRNFRGDKSRNRNKYGSGIGLDIAYQIIKKHSWKMEMSKSEYGGLFIKFIGKIDKITSA